MGHYLYSTNYGFFKPITIYIFENFLDDNSNLEFTCTKVFFFNLGTLLNLLLLFSNILCYYTNNSQHVRQ